jgi:hypothetical protein
MPRYMISFDDGSMDHIPEEDLPVVGESVRALVREAKAEGIWIFGGGFQRQKSSIVATDGTNTNGPVPETKAVVGGFSIILVSSSDEALLWTGRACGIRYKWRHPLVAMNQECRKKEHNPIVRRCSECDATS